MKIKFITIILLILSLSLPTYANFVYSRTYYNKEAKITNQYDTGEYGYVSCVPTSIKMILDYQGVKSESVAMMFYRMNGNDSGVYVQNAIDYLNSLSHTVALPQYISDKSVFKYYIDKNNPYLISINPLKIKNQSELKIPVLSKPIGKDYYTYQNSLHLVAVIGYVEINTDLYLEVLDPLSRQILYYNADNVMEALEWKCLITMQYIEGDIDE